ncbi:MAG: hypothetical protein J6M31_01845 [Bacteroidales bacterium]|nr:hypothetical protein [Bacteroidales bacterium]MBP3202331.1 hypothetical protein [Bacteroidales bacterium]
MDKCLVTRLKGTAVADLPFYDAIRLWIKWGDNTTFPIKATGSLENIFFGGIGTTVKVISNGTIKVGSDNVGTEYTITESSTSTIDIIPSDVAQDTLIILKGLSSISKWGPTTGSPHRMAHTDDSFSLAETSIAGTTVALLAGASEPCDLAVLEVLPNKSTITTLLWSLEQNAYKGDIHHLAAIPGLIVTGTALAAFNSGVYGDIAVFNGNTAIRNVELRRSDRIVGMIDNLSGCSALSTVDLQSTQVTGNLAALGNCVNLTKIVLSSTSVTGTVEDLVAAFNAAGKTSGSISIGFQRTGVTYNGSSVSGTTLTWNGSNITIS